MSDIWSKEYWAHKGDVRLFVYRKRLGEPVAGEDPRPVVFLVHGSSFSSPSAFDLTVPGHDDYSLMDRLASQGYDVWTMDNEGYGRSDRRPDSNADISCGADDLRAAVDVISTETGQTRYSYYGQSSGALKLGLFAQRHPSWIDKLILDAFPWTGEGAPTLIKRRENLDYYRTHNTRPVDREFFHSIFTRDKPGTSDPAVGDIIADIELQYGDAVPTGTYLDMCANLPVIDPTPDRLSDARAAGRVRRSGDGSRRTRLLRRPPQPRQATGGHGRNGTRRPAGLQPSPLLASGASRSWLPHPGRTPRISPRLSDTSHDNVTTRTG
jgi:pimeloyl-ACP methyl ester carboxylesterase